MNLNQEYKGPITCQLDAFQMDAVNFQRANKTRSNWTRPRIPDRRGCIVMADTFTRLDSQVRYVHLMIN